MPPLFQRLFGRSKTSQPASQKAAHGPWRLSDPSWPKALAMSSSFSGKSVTDVSAMQLSAVWACVRLTSETIASLPLQMFEKDASGGRKPIDHPLVDVLDSPNPEMTGFELWQAMSAWLCMRGNAYAEIGRVGDRVVALNVLPADRITVVRDESGDLRYQFTDRGKLVDLEAESVLHIRGFGLGGEIGLSPIQYGVQTMGSATATEEAAGKFFANGLMSSGLLKIPADVELTYEQREQLKEIIEAYAGSNRAGKVLMVDHGMDFTQLSLDPESTQMLESRRFSVEEISRWFGCPPVLIGHAGVGQTMWGTGVEAIVLQWLTTGLNPFLTRIERRIRKQLIGPGERRRVYAEFNREALLQADSVGKAAFLSTMVQNGLMSRAEGRAKLNLPARDGADVLTAQSNLAPLDRLGGDSDAGAKTALRSWLGLEDPK